MNNEVSFWKDSVSTRFEVEVRYYSDSEKGIFGITHNQNIYGLLYCDKIVNGKYEAPLTKIFDYKNKTIILEIGKYTLRVEE